MATYDFRGWVSFFQLNGHRGLVALKKAIAEPACNFIERQSLEHHIASEEQYTCNVCGDMWPTRQQLAVHPAKAHKRCHEVRRFLEYPVTHCYICMLQKHTRQGLVEHLTDKRNDTCISNLMLQFKPVGLRISRVWDQQASGEPDRRVSGRTPAYRLPGPTLPIVGVDGEYRHALGGPGHKHMAL